jgi:hypothetical protein
MVLTVGPARRAQPDRALQLHRAVAVSLCRADSKQFRAMVVRGIGTGKADLSKVPELAADPKNPKAGNHPRLWAAFTLSGLRR